MKRTALLVAGLLVSAGCVSVGTWESLVESLPAESLLEVEGRRVFVEDRGSGPPVLLVHGFGSSSYSWRDVVAELERDFRVVTVDLAGFGMTERPQSKHEYTRHAQGELLLGVLDALGIDQAHLVGHSYGGSVSVALALRRPDRLSSLTLVNSAAPEYPQVRRTPLAALRPLTALMVRTRSLRRSNVEASLLRSIENDSLVDDQLIDEYWRRLAIKESQRAFWALTTPMADPQGAISVTDLALPTLFLWGEADTLIPPAGARQVASQMAVARFVGLPHAGHAPMEDQPRELASIMRKFFLTGLAGF